MNWGLNFDLTGDLLKNELVRKIDEQKLASFQKE